MSKIDKLFNTKLYLPKCWIMRIDKIWEKRIPTNYPKSSSSFLFVTDQNERNAVSEMEHNIGTDQSIIDPSIIPEHNDIGAYLGTYDVVGDVNATTLLSPHRLPKNNSGAIAYHYTGEDWELIENIEIINGYVYGSLDSFSPIAVFSLRKDSYYLENDETYGANVYVCNGITTKIYKDGDNIIAESGYGKKTTITAYDIIIGGSIDGSNIDKTNISMNGIDNFYGMIIGGNNYCVDQIIPEVKVKDQFFKTVGYLEDAILPELKVAEEIPDPVTFKNKCKLINIFIKDSNIAKSENGSGYGLITGAGVWCCADEVNITLEDSSVESVSNGIYEFNNNISNTSIEMSKDGLGANQWIKKSNINIDNSYITCLYGGGENKGYEYTESSDIKVNNSTILNFTSQVFGTMNKLSAYFNNCEMYAFSSFNYGYLIDEKVILNNCSVDTLTIFAPELENTDNISKVLGKIYIDMNKNTIIRDLNIGYNNFEELTQETAKQHIGYFKISRDTDIDYSAIKDIVIIK